MKSKYLIDGWWASSSDQMWIDCSNCFKRYQLFIILSPVDSITKIRGFIYTHQFLPLTLIERRRRGWQPILYQRKGGCMNLVLTRGRGKNAGNLTYIICEWLLFLTWTPCFVPFCLFGESGHFSSCVVSLKWSIHSPNSSFSVYYCLLHPHVFCGIRSYT